MPVLNPWWGLLLLGRWLDPHIQNNSLTSDIVLDCFERFSQTYLRDALAFLLIDDFGNLITHIEKLPVGFDYTDIELCQQFVGDLDKVHDFTLWGFGILERNLPENRKAIARPIPQVHQTIFVIVKRNKGLYSV